MANRAPHLHKGCAGPFETDPPSVGAARQQAGMGRLDHATHDRRTAGIRASRPSPRVPAKRPLVNGQWAFSRCGGNRSSYPPHLPSAGQKSLYRLVRSKSNLQRDLHQLWHTVLLGAGDDLIRDGERQLTAGIDIAAVVDARPDPRLGRFVAKCG